MPTGFMPSFDSSGKIALVICTLEGEKTVYIDKDQTPTAQHENHDEASSLCSFSLMSAAFVFNKSPSLTSEATYTAAIYNVFRLYFEQRQQISSNYPTGPPSAHLL